MDAEDVQNLLPPLLNLLDGRHDFPYPRDKEKGTCIVVCLLVCNKNKV